MNYDTKGQVVAHDATLETPKPTQQPNQENTPSNHRNLSVLVVDDTAILRSILKDILFEFCGIERASVAEAADGRQAVREYKRIHPDIVFLDITMPNLSGTDAVKEIIEHDPDARIIMCTGAGERHMVRTCVRAGAMDYIVKPLNPARVAEAVEKVMNGVRKVVAEEPEEVEEEKVSEVSEE